MEFAGIKFVTDESLEPNEVRVGYPHVFDVWARPGGEVFRMSSTRTDDGSRYRLDWSPGVIAARDTS